MQKQRFNVIITYPTNGTRAIGVFTRLSRVGAMWAKNIGRNISEI